LEARADERLVRLLVQRVEEGSRRAPQLLAAIGDPAAAPALREVMSHADPQIRAAAISSIGWSGERSDVPAAATATEDAEEAVRTAGRATLADLGGQDAAEALAAGLDGLEEEERAHGVEALAWLGDTRASRFKSSSRRSSAARPGTAAGVCCARSLVSAPPRTSCG
jgi:HEAT repeat protein